MIAENLTSKNIPILKPEDSIFQALDLLEEYKLDSLPVVNDMEYLGLVSEDILLNAYDDTLPLSEIQLLGKNYFCYDDIHFMEVLRIMFKNYYSIIPVLDQKNQFKGVISYKDVLSEVSKMIAFESFGGTIILKVNVIDYSLAEIARLVESNGAQIVLSYIQKGDRDDTLYVSIKINEEDASHVVSTFERFNFLVIAVFHKTDKEDLSQQRLDNLFKYLNM